MDFIILMPFYNEEEQIPLTIETLLHQENLQDYDYSLLMVNDGSRDKTWEAILAGTKKYPGRVRGLHLSRNFGKEAAICAGLDHADADAVILMDGDLQHPPEHIRQMLDLWEEGYDVVEGVKNTRGKESSFNRVMAKNFYGLFKKIAGYTLENASDYKLLDRKVIMHWRTLKEHNTFFRGLSQWLGFHRTTFSFDVQPRQTGKTKFSVRSLLRLSFDAITSFSAVPLHLITYIGILFFLGALILSVHTLVKFFNGSAAGGFPTVILVELIIGSCIMISLGLIGIYIGRIFDEVKDRPRYIISEDTQSLPSKKRRRTPGKDN